MTTTAPHTFSVDINRHDYLRQQVRDQRTGIGLISFFWIGLGSTFIVKKHLPTLFLQYGTAPTLIMWLLGIIGASMIFSWIYMAAYGNRRAQRTADAFQALIEGSFLRIITLSADKKVHFREIVDYEVDLTTETVNQGISEITMRTTVGGQNPMILKLPAVENVFETRDLLAKVDAERE